MIEFRYFMVPAQSHFPPGDDRSENPKLAVLTHEVWTTGNCLSKVLRLEAYFRQLSKEYENDAVIEQWEAARKLVQLAADDYVAASDRLLEAISGDSRGRREGVTPDPSKRFPFLA